MVLLLKTDKIYCMMSNMERLKAALISLFRLLTVQPDRTS